MVSKPIQLVPRWCETEDILKGWVVIHKEKNPLKHLANAKIKCVATDRTIYCRIRGPGTKKGKGVYYQKHEEEKVKESIFLDAYYVEKLGLDKFMESNVDFLISKGCSLLSCLMHPEDAIRTSSCMGILALITSIIALVLGILSLLPKPLP